MLGNSSMHAEHPELFLCFLKIANSRLLIFKILKTPSTLTHRNRVNVNAVVDRLFSPQWNETPWSSMTILLRMHISPVWQIRIFENYLFDTLIQKRAIVLKTTCFSHFLAFGLLSHLINTSVHINPHFGNCAC
jgi:hypothetical protein